MDVGANHYQNASRTYYPDLGWSVGDCSEIDLPPITHDTDEDEVPCRSCRHLERNGKRLLAMTESSSLVASGRQAVRSTGSLLEPFVTTDDHVATSLVR